MTNRLSFFLATLAAILPSMAHAYVGPGLGIGVIVTVLGVIGAGLLAIVSFIYFPIKRMRKKRKAALAAADHQGQDS